MAKFLIVSGNFYRDLADELLKGASAALEKAGHEYVSLEVPGALEIPQAIRYGIETEDFAGYIALGTVIRGETAHYDVVAGESSRALMDLALDHQAPIGNGILTVENREQAWARARVSEKNKGADAANAAIALFEIKHQLH
jgi:6,7-dimethyl-8-ribityllumazine synthase